MENAMPRMTEEEAWALEDGVTRNPPKVDPSKARHPVHMIAVDDFSADWLRIMLAYMMPGTRHDRNIG